MDGVASYQWDFGNGFTFNGLTPPPQTYLAGVYNISLTITSTGGCVSTPATGVVKVGNVQPVANFNAVPTTQCVNQNIQFNDLSTGNPDQWLWDFGDGTTNSTANPIHPYTTPGVYDVSLTVYNQGCFQKLTKTAYITINSPKAGFSYSFACGNKTNYTFTDNSIGATGWDWDFGDGTAHSNATSPTHVYSTMVPASYNVTLTVTNSATGCSDKVTQKVDVNQSTTINPIAGPTCAKSTVTIFTTAPGNIVGYQFDFGDGQTCGFR